MKVIAVLFALLATAAAFAPSAVNGRTATVLEAAKRKTPFFEQVFGMDLFAPNPNVNNYGARAKKNLKQGKIGANSYVPAGLSKAEYSKVRAKDAAKANASYKNAAAKAGKYVGFTKWYKNRGTDTSGSWVKTVSRGHTFAKTKYDYSGRKDEQKQYDGRS